VMMLLPDHAQPRIFEESIAPSLKPGKTLMFAHGFNIHFNQILPPAGVDVSMTPARPPPIAEA
jgi:ketol-acid reductoisomerase